MRVLSLNTYAGSLLLGAKAVGAEIIGSYEDSGFGQGIAQENFPNLEHIPLISQWPTRDLKDTVVIAHPPCSAFSVQNYSPAARGVNSNAFACTRHVLDYAMKNDALGIAVESVMGALGGAWNVHQKYADDYGYNLYRIVQNGCMFGAQWRERFWAVWIKKGAASDTMRLELVPNWQTVQQRIDGYEDGPTVGNLDKLLKEQKERLVAAGFTQEEMDFYFLPQNPPHRTTALGTVIWETKYKKPDSLPEERWDMFADLVGTFTSGTMCYLDPNGLSPVLMGGSFWYTNGRNLSESGYKRIGGFPHDYVFPVAKRNYRSQMRMYLSKGVMPPVAGWVLGQIGVHLDLLNGDETVPQGILSNNTPVGVSGYQLEVEPNHIADFRISKEGWKNRGESLPELKHFDEQPKPSKAYIEVAPTPCPNCQGVGRVGDDGQPCHHCEGRGHATPVAVPPVPKPRVPKPVRTRPAVQPRGPNDETLGGRLGGIRIYATRAEIQRADASDARTKRRLIMLDIIEKLGNPTHDEAVLASIEHPEVQITTGTARWHVRQMVQLGWLAEGSPIQGASCEQAIVDDPAELTA